MVELNSERQRINALHELNILDTPPSAAFDAIVETAAAIFNCTTSLVSLMAEDRLWFKAKCGIDLDGTSREIAFCDYTISLKKPLVVYNTTSDPRFCNNPLVTGEPNIRFYAGVPLSLDRELYLGTLCVIGTEPQVPSDEQIAQLVRLGRAVEGLLLAHRHLVRSTECAAEANRQAREAGRRGALLSQVEKMAAIGAWRINVPTTEVIWSDQIRIIHELEGGEKVNLEDALSFYPEPDRTLVRNAVKDAIELGKSFKFDIDFITARGRKRRIRASADVEMDEGKPAHVIGIFQDITEYYEAERALWLSAHVDHLSGIANRHWFQKDLAERLLKRQGQAKKIHVLMIDLDGFKEVNDTLGHQAGDEVIKTVAQRLEQVAGTGAFVARLGGDEFAIIVDRSISYSSLRVLADETLSQVSLPIRFYSDAIHVTASLGIACFPDDADTPDGLLRCADMALYKVKRSGGGNIGFYTSQTATIFDTRRTAIDKVRTAAAAGRIMPHYQPKFRLADLSVYGFEALARIVDDDGSIIGPSEFWPAFSDPMSSRTITEHMLNAVAADIASWRCLGLDPGIISFNASEFSFLNPDFADLLTRKIDAMNVPRSSLEVEITETVLWGDDLKLVGQILAELRSAGMQISLDDFGTGYASLTHLRDFPINTLKIDQSFIAGLGKKPQNTAIVKAIVELGHNLGMAIVAEGIETQSQLDFLQSIGCDNGQGYLISKPLPADNVLKLLRG